MTHSFCEDQVLAAHPRTPDAGSFHYTGETADLIPFVQQSQLLDPALWATFVRQFRDKRDDGENAWRGEYWGKMMRGAALTYACTGSEELYNCMTDTVLDMLSVQDELGRFSTCSVENEFRHWDVWCRKYVLLGFEYFLEVCRDDALADRIVAALCRHADYIMEKIGPEPGQIDITKTSDFWLGMNSCSIMEPFVRLYRLTGNHDYLDFVSYVISTGGMDGFDLYDAMLNKSVYPYETPAPKAYEMMSNFEGILEYYLATGDETYKTMVVNFAELVLESDITVIGCAGTDFEQFNHAKARQCDPSVTDLMQETCVTVTWIKFCHRMLTLTGDAKYADAIEQSVYNALAGSVNREGHPLRGQVYTFDSYSPLIDTVRGRQLGGHMVIDDEGHEWGCCVAIGAAGTAYIGLSAVMPTDDGLAANLYLPGTCEGALPGGGTVKLTCETDYPKTGAVRYTVTTDAPRRFALSLRIPAWADGTAVSVNGARLTAQPGGYFRIDRVWQAGDTVTVDFPMVMRLLRASELDPDATGVVADSFALLRGPIVFCRDSNSGEAIAEAVEPIEENGGVRCEPAENTRFPALQTYRVLTADGGFTVSDYGSCGQSWDPEKPIRVFMNGKPRG